MALLFVDSFDHYTSTTDFALKWTTRTGETITAAGGRFGGGATGGNASASKTITAAATMICGAAVKIAAFGSAGSILGFANGAAVHCSVGVDAAGHLTARGPGGGVYASGTGASVLTAGVWYYIEAKVFIHDTTGTFVLKLNETTELSLSSLDTRNGATTTVDNIVIGTSNGSLTVTYDDFYVCDTTGSAPTNDFLGDVRVEAIFPSTAGNSAQWTPLSSTNVSNVDETAPDGDTTYNSSSTANQVDSFNYTNVTPSTATVYGIQYNLYARKDDAGTRTIAPLSRHSSTDYPSATTHNLSTSYAYYTQILEQNPGTSAAWTVSDVNGDEFGYKEIA